jgi:ribosomal protein L37E
MGHAEPDCLPRRNNRLAVVVSLGYSKKRLREQNTTLLGGNMSVLITDTDARNVSYQTPFECHDCGSRWFQGDKRSCEHTSSPFEYLIEGYNWRPKTQPERDLENIFTDGANGDEFHPSLQAFVADVPNHSLAFVCVLIIMGCVVGIFYLIDPVVGVAK